MSKEKLIGLTKYSNELKAKLSDTVPAKHKNRAKQYHAFLEKDLKAVNAQIDNLKLAGADKK